METLAPSGGGVNSVVELAPKSMNPTRLLLLASLCSAALPAFADCTAIDALPYVVVTPGSYCLTGNLATTGNGISIKANDVVVDLQGFRIDGPTDTATKSNGIFGYGYQRITVRNGSVSGFLYGVYLSDYVGPARTAGTALPGGLHVVEKLEVRGARFRGIRVEGNGNVVKDNVVRFVGGTTAYANAWVTGIETYGPGAKVTGNVVYEVRGSGSGTGIGIAVYDRSPAVVVSHNTVANASVTADPLYVWASDSASTIGIYLGHDARSAVVEENQVTNFATGVSIDPAAAALLSRNAVSGSSSGSYVVPAASVYAPDNVCDQPTCVIVP